LRIEIPVISPLASRSTSKMENGRRRSGSVPRDGFTITNCPGLASAPMAGAANETTL
jgi:hypothetical protein